MIYQWWDASFSVPLVCITDVMHRQCTSDAMHQLWVLVMPRISNAPTMHSSDIMHKECISNIPLRFFCNAQQWIPLVPCTSNAPAIYTSGGIHQQCSSNAVSGLHCQWWDASARHQWFIKVMIGTGTSLNIFTFNIPHFHIQHATVSHFCHSPPHTWVDESSVTNTRPSLERYFYFATDGMCFW